MEQIRSLLMILAESIHSTLSNSLGSIGVRYACKKIWEGLLNLMYWTMCTKTAGMSVLIVLHVCAPVQVFYLAFCA